MTIVMRVRGYRKTDRLTIYIAGRMSQPDSGWRCVFLSVIACRKIRQNQILMS